MYVIVVVLLTRLLRAEMYNTRVRRSVWISTPSSMQYQSRPFSASPVHTSMFFPYQNDLAEVLNTKYLVSSGYPQVTRAGAPGHKEAAREMKPRHSKRSWWWNFKASLYTSLFGGGLVGVFVHIFIASLFAVIGYQVRKQEEYGSYVRLPAEDS